MSAALRGSRRHVHAGQARRPRRQRRRHRRAHRALQRRVAGVVVAAATVRSASGGPPESPVGLQHPARGRQENPLGGLDAGEVRGRDTSSGVMSRPSTAPTRRPTSTSARWAARPRPARSRRRGRSRGPVSRRPRAARPGERVAGARRGSSRIWPASGRAPPEEVLHEVALVGVELHQPVRAAAQRERARGGRGDRATARSGRPSAERRRSRRRRPRPRRTRASTPRARSRQRTPRCSRHELEEPGEQGDRRQRASRSRCPPRPSHGVSTSASARLSSAPTEAYRARSRIRPSATSVPIATPVPPRTAPVGGEDGHRGLRGQVPAPSQTSSTGAASTVSTTVTGTTMAIT